MEENQPGPTRKLAVYSLVFFFLSGMCGLIYQILWTRVLNLLFGHTTFAIGTVIAVFMGGLALGSLYFGRWADGAGPLKRLLLKQGGSPVFLAYGHGGVRGHLLPADAFSVQLYKNAYLNTDDRPWLEFSAPPRNLYEPTTPVNMRGLAKYRGGPLPPVRGYPASRPLSAEYYLAAVRQAEKVGDAVLLEKALKEALSVYPTDFDLRMFKAQRLIRAGKTLKGERELREIVFSNPGERAGYAALARFYRDQGFPERAEPLYERAIRMDTGDEELNGEFIAFLRKQKKLDKAAALLEELRKEHPDAARYQFLSGLLRMDGKDYAGASKFFEAVLERKPGSYEVMKNLLAAYREMGDNEKVIRIGEELVKQNPYDREALVDFGKALMKSGEVKRGRKILVRAMQLNPYENREIEEFLEGRIASP